MSWLLSIGSWFGLKQGVSTVFLDSQTSARITGLSTAVFAANFLFSAAQSPPWQMLSPPLVAWTGDFCHPHGYAAEDPRGGDGRQECCLPQPSSPVVLKL